MDEMKLNLGSKLMRKLAAKAWRNDIVSEKDVKSLERICYTSNFIYQ